jgi:hypothetical protein
MVTIYIKILPALAELNFLLEAGVFEGDILPRGVLGVLAVLADLSFGLLVT